MIPADSRGIISISPTSSAPFHQGGEEISFTGRLAQMQVAVSVRQGDSILRLTKSQTVFRNGDWGLFAALMCILLVVAIYISFVMARRIVTPISQLSNAAQSIIDGHASVNLRLEGYSELNQLLHCCNR